MTISESKQDLTADTENLDEEQGDCFGIMEEDDTLEIPDIILTATEKKFLLSAERGDCGTVRNIIEEQKNNIEEFNINCVDPLNRTALISAIENENIDLIKLLLEAGIKVKDALLHAIKEEYVEAVETLIKWEEQNHVKGEPYSWEVVDRASSTFTPDITPLILAAHRNHYEILKLLLDRGATLPMPHDVRCGCDDCVRSSDMDSLRHSQARINAYKALSASSLISLSSRDPILTAFELSWELRRLSRMETEFRLEYNEMRKHCQEFATALLDHARTSLELGIMLNYNPNPKEDNWEPGQRQTLERLKLAIKYKQKMFVAHPNVQQLLASIWYEGLPGFRRKGFMGQIMQVAKFGMMFPIFSFIYMIAPHSTLGKFMKKPFVKFICHSSSYAFFLMLLGAASQRLEHVVLDWIGIPWMLEFLARQKKFERGSIPGFTEFFVLLYVISLIWHEIRSLWMGGLADYISDLWNIVDFISNFFYVMWIALRFASWYIVQRDARAGLNPWLPRESWDEYDPMLLSEGAFAAGMIFSFLKLVHIFSINPHLGPLQVSLGRMIIDIIKFFFIYTLVLFAFGCGLNQLMWYYADLERGKCYHIASDPDLPDFDNHEKSCAVWRRFANLFETSQSLFWASFGLVDMLAFELQGIKTFTRFWALLMFGSYSVINIIVLLNMLIAMMSNSYQIISERSDVEWKFARSQLWMSYFEDGDTVPPPFNILPTMKIFCRLFGCRKCGHNNKKSECSFKKSMDKVTRRHDNVMRLLVRRYITAEQRKRDEFGVTEDDVMEIRQDISTLRFELIDILHQNGMRTPRIKPEEQTVPGKKGRVMERRILKDFQIGFVEGIVSDVILSNSQPKDVFSTIAKVIGRRTTIKPKPKDWNALVRRNTIVGDPIGSTRTSMIRRRRRSLRRQIVQSANEGLQMDTEKLVEYNPKLLTVTPVTRVAYVKFMAKKLKNEVDDNSDRGSIRSNTSISSSKSTTVQEENIGSAATTSAEPPPRPKTETKQSAIESKLCKNEPMPSKIDPPPPPPHKTGPPPPIVMEFRVQSPIIEDPYEDQSTMPIDSTKLSPAVGSSEAMVEKPSDGEISIISDGKDSGTVKFTPTVSQPADIKRERPKPRKAGNWL